MTSISSADLQRLLDERDIVAVAVDCAWALDTGAWEALSDVFTPDATARFDDSTRLDGIDAIVERLRTELSAFDGSQHVLGNHQVTLDGKSATHRCHVHARHVSRRCRRPAPGRRRQVRGRPDTDRRRMADHPPHAAGDVDRGCDGSLT